MGKNTISRQEASGGDKSREPLSALGNFPNQLTFTRLILSVIFFVMLALVNHNYFQHLKAFWLNVSIGVFLLAAITDFLDGYLARKWNMVSTFGRIADPIVDKVFICGSFVLLIHTSALVVSWIPVVILTREFLVSGLRSLLESRGLPFGAGFWGKLKMVFQSITIFAVLFYEANARGSLTIKWIVIFLLTCTILTTLSSCVEYLVRAWRILKAERR